MIECVDRLGAIVCEVRDIFAELRIAHKVV